MPGPGVGRDGAELDVYGLGLLVQALCGGGLGAAGAAEAVHRGVEARVRGADGALASGLLVGGAVLLGAAPADPSWWRWASTSSTGSAV